MKLKRKTPSGLFPSPYKTKYTRYPIHFYISKKNMCTSMGMRTYFLFAEQRAQRIQVLRRGFVEFQLQGIVFAIAGDQVHMEVRDALTGCLMDVADDVHAGRAGLLHDAHRQHAGRLHQVRQRLIIAGQKAVAVLLRDDERMAAGDLGNVQERHDLIIFIDDG